MSEATPASPGVAGRITAMVERYGPMALVVWFGVFFANIGLVVVLLEAGLSHPWLATRMDAAAPWLQATLSGWGVDSPWLLAHGVSLAAAYLVAKALMPLRIVLVAALLPWIARRRG